VSDLIYGHALKETASVIEALLDGDQAVLLRKGGMGEDGFDLEADRFLMLPTRKSKKKGRYERHNDLLTDERFDTEEIVAAAEATSVEKVTVDPDSYPEVLLDETVFNRQGVEKKVGYKTDVLLSLVFVRVYRIEPAVALEMREEYGGCTSWVELGEQFEIDVEPVLSDEEYREKVGRIKEVLSSYEWMGRRRADDFPFSLRGKRIGPYSVDQEGSFWETAILL